MFLTSGKLDYQIVFFNHCTCRLNVRSIVFSERVTTSCKSRSNNVVLTPILLGIVITFLAVFDTFYKDLLLMFDRDCQQLQLLLLIYFNVGFTKVVLTTVATSHTQLF